ncbi:MAG: capsule assembly Wzi family protein [Bacteroidaceae bacterium]|nr:capsule assembly Wzi family protein [Bacteroidaceae bacterium]
MKKVLLGVVALLSGMMPLHVSAQDDYQFDDDPFLMQQGGVNSIRPRQNSGWRPSQYASQEALIKTMTAQQIKRSLKYRLETVATASDGANAPFWLSSNRQGLVSVSNGMAYARYGMFGQMILPNTFSVRYGMDLGIGSGLEDDWFVQQMYLDFGYKCWNFSIGMKERPGTLVNNDLSSGALVWSGNCKPVPQARFGMPEYYSFASLNGILAVRWDMSYGLFTDDEWRGRNPENGYTDHILYHGKELFLKIGDHARFPLELTLGIEMNAMFGGVMHNRGFCSRDTIFDNYRLPSDLGAFANIIVPLNKAGQQTRENGNTVGSWHVSLDCFFDKEWSARAYYEHYFEDHSSMLGIEYKANSEGENGFVTYGFRRNWLDGLYGLEVNLPDGLSVRNVVVEFLNTRGQCGAVYKPQDVPLAEGIDGRDGMYNHEVYDSYSHHGLAAGSPVLLSPVYNSNGKQRFLSNRVNMLHLGIDGGVGTHLDYKLKLTATRHWGTYERPFVETRDICSGELSLYWLAGDSYSLKYGISVGMDSDDSGWLGNNRGVMLSVVKTWNIL